MTEFIEQFLYQPWYVLVIFLLVSGHFVYTYFRRGMDSVNKNDVSYRYAKESTLTNEQQFSLALDAVMTAYWEVDNNTLAFTHKSKRPRNFDAYMKGWFIDSREGYQDLKNYFLADGRRGYFNFIYPLYKNVPRASWAAKMQNEYGSASRPQAILARLSEHNVVNALLQHGIIATEADMDIGVLGWDVSVLIGQARRAYTAGLVSEEEAWHTINQAMQLAVHNFKSWSEFGRSQMIGMALDYYQHDDDFFNDYIETYHQVVRDIESPWNTIAWGIKHASMSS